MANGPSARDFDTAILRDKIVLAVNEVACFSSLRFATAVFSLDPRWICRRRVFLSEEFTGEKYLAVPLETWPECGGVPGAVYLRRSHEAGLSNDPGALCTGGNSGYAAINLAYLKGAETIHLVGYDMDPKMDDKYRQWIPRFRTMLPQLRRKDVTVLNHNKNSFIDAFPFV